MKRELFVDELVWALIRRKTCFPRLLHKYRMKYPAKDERGGLSESPFRLNIHDLIYLQVK